MSEKDYKLLNSSFLTESGWPESSTSMARCYNIKCSVPTKVPSAYYAIDGLCRMNFCSQTCKTRYLSFQVAHQERHHKQEGLQEKYVNRIISAPVLDLGGGVVFEPTHAALANKRVYRLCIVCDSVFRNENNNAVEKGIKGEVHNDTKVYYDGFVVFLCGSTCGEKFDLSPWVYMEKPSFIPKPKEN